MNLDLFDSSSNQKIIYELKDAHLEYFPNFLENSKINFDSLKDELNWQQDEIVLYGKVHPVPRLQAWYADFGLNYSYSGIKLMRNNWSDSLISLKKEIEQTTGDSFNGCLCNLYRDGSDYVSWHSDDEKELGKNPIIASISLGETRKFAMMHKYDKGIEKFELELENGSLLIMRGRTQHFWKHQISKTKKKVSPRINLTYRNLIE